MGETIKSYLVGLGFGVDDTSLAQFNKAIASAAIRVTALYASIQVATAGIFKGISGIADSFEDLGYKTHMIIPAISKTILLRRAMYDAYNRAGIDLKKVVKQSVDFNFSLAKTKMALDAVYKSVGARFLPLLTKQMDIFRTKIFANMPKIQATLEKMIKFLFKAFEATVILGTRMWEVLGRVWDFFSKLDQATDGWSTKILIAVAAWKFLNLAFLTTPLGMLIAGFITLLGLWDDFKTFQEGGKSLIDWGSQATKTVLGIVTVVASLAAVIGTVIVALKLWTVVQAVLDALLLLNPIGLWITGITILIGLIAALALKMGYLKGVSSFFSGLGDKVIGFAGGLGLGGAAAALADPNASGALNSINQPTPLVNQNNGVNQRVSQETNINVQGSADANSTAKAVSGEQSKVNFDLTRNLKGATR